MKRRLRTAPKLPDPKLGLIRVGDMVTRAGLTERMIVVSEYGTRGVHCQSVASGHIATWSKKDLQHVVEDGRVLTHRDIA